MEQRNKTAIIIGATGLTGGQLLNALLSDNRYQKIKLISRTSIGINSDKIEEFLGNVIDLENFARDFTGDEVFCCIGTTQSKTPDKEMYRKIDYGIPVKAAELCKTNGIDTFLVISALGSNPKSKVFYNRLKGEMENAVMAIGLRHTYILQPSLINGKRNEWRFGEWLVKQLFKVFDLLLLGPLKKYQSIHPDEIVKCMIWLANNKPIAGRISSEKIKKLAKSA